MGVSGCAFKPKLWSLDKSYTWSSLRFRTVKNQIVKVHFTSLVWMRERKLHSKENLTSPPAPPYTTCCKYKLTPRIHIWALGVRRVYGAAAARHHAAIMFIFGSNIKQAQKFQNWTRTGIIHIPETLFCLWCSLVNYLQNPIPFFTAVYCYNTSHCVQFSVKYRFIHIFLHVKWI